MSDGVDITRGGAVAVDTASLERAASGLDRVADDLRGLADRAARARDAVVDAADASGGAAVDTAGAAVSGLGDATDRARDVAGRLRESARAYAIVELANEQTLALAAGDRGRADAAGAALAAARAADPSAARLADAAIVQWRAHWAVYAAGDVSDPFVALDPLAAGLGLLYPAAIALSGRGLVPRGAVPTGPAPAVEVRPVGPPAAPCAPPESLAAAMGRIPSGQPDDDDLDGAARIRVEAATMPDGSCEYTVYLSGTQDFPSLSGDAFDGQSDVQLYGGQDAASFEATKAALVQAGAQPGDALTIVGFSQGALVGAYLAQDPTYDVQAALFAGSPVTTDLPDDVLSVSLVHDDDVVAALQGPIASGATGSADSLVVTRSWDPPSSPADITVPAHRQDAYVDTARLVDASDDPRVTAMRAYFDRLATARSVVVTEYTATTPSG